MVLVVSIVVVVGFLCSRLAVPLLAIVLSSCDTSIREGNDIILSDRINPAQLCRVPLLQTTGRGREVGKI